MRRDEEMSYGGAVPSEKTRENKENILREQYRV